VQASFPKKLRFNGVKKIYFVVTDSGGGHRTPALALQNHLKNLGMDWEITIINLYTEVLEKYDLTSKWLHFSGEDIYNFLIQRKSLNFFIRPFLVYVQSAFRISHQQIRKTLEDYWREHKPDMVVSLIPFANGVIGESLQHLPHVPLVVILTDFEEWKPQTWFGSPFAHYICPTAEAVQQAKDLRLQHVYKTSGLVLKSDFYELPPIDVASERQKLNLDPHLSTGIVVFGASGSNNMLQILNALKQSSLRLQLIFICGNNKKLALQLKNISTRFPKLVLGRVENIPFYMSLSDFFIGKPGAGSINEALLMHLPVITECSLFTPPQERANAEFVRQQGYGICLKSFKSVESSIQYLLAHYDEFKARVMRYNNQGIFEVPQILSMILNQNIIPSR